MFRVRILILLTLLIAAFAVACDCRGERPTAPSGSSSCPFQTGSKTARTAYDGSTATVQKGTCIKPKPSAGAGAVDVKPQQPPIWGLTEQELAKLQQNGKIYSVLDITPDGHTWNPPIEVVFILKTPGPYPGYKLTIFQWSSSQNDWNDAGTAEVQADVNKARGKITHTSLFAVVDSDWASSIVVPNVLRQNIDDARAALWDAGLEVGEVAEEVTANQSPGVVLWQSHDPGIEVEPGTPIDLVIAIPEEGIEVPDLVGYDVELAQNIIWEMGLEVGKISEQSGGDSESGAVLWQSYPNGAIVAAGTPIDLVVAAQEPQAEPPVAAFYAEAIENAEIVDDNLVWAGCKFTLGFVNLSSNANWYYWDFGDGKDSKEFEPVHSYSAPEGESTYTVRLVAGGPGGENEKLKVDFIRTECLR